MFDLEKRLLLNRYVEKLLSDDEAEVTDESSSIFLVEELMPVLKTETFKRFVIMNRRKEYEGSGLTQLLCTLENGIIQVSELLRRPGISDEFNEYILRNKAFDKLLMAAQNKFTDALMVTNCVYYIISSACKKIISIKPWKQGKYILAIDALDGMENMTSCLPMATTFGIYKPNQSKENYYDLFHTTASESMVAAGYAVYGTTTSMVIAIKGIERVVEFCFDNVLGEFVMSTNNMQMPLEGKFVSANIAQRDFWLNNAFKSYIRMRTDEQRALQHRHVGSFTSNFHYILKNGGIIVDAASQKLPHGKFQLLSKLNPLAFVCHKVGGKSYGKDLHTNMLDITARSIHETFQGLFGSIEEIKLWDEFAKQIARNDTQQIVF